MSRRECPRAFEVVQEVRAGGDLEAHREHLAGCPVCRETVTITRWLGEVAVETERAARVPTAESIWWRAQVIKKLAEVEERELRRVRPLALVHIVGVALAVVTVVGILLGSAPQAVGIVEALTGLLGDAGAAILAIGALGSAATGAIIAWRASEELG